MNKTISGAGHTSLAFLRTKVRSMNKEEYERFRDSFLATQRA